MDKVKYVGLFGIQCERCSLILKEEEKYDFHGEVLCEDCYFYVINPPKACDPIAVATALSIRKQLGQSGTISLTELQKQIYSVIEQRGKVIKEELLTIIKLASLHILVLTLDMMKLRQLANTCDSFLNT